jgi:hypothetical protein
VDIQFTGLAIGSVETALGTLPELGECTIVARIFPPEGEIDAQAIAGCIGFTCVCVCSDGSEQG